MALSKITNDGVATSGLPAGSVVQVVQGTVNEAPVLTTLTTAQASGVTASITPSSSSNKVLVIAYIGGAYHSVASQNAAYDIYRGGVSSGTKIISSVSVFGTARIIGNNDTGSLTITFLDSPATTSSVSYEMSLRTVTGSGTTYLSVTSEPSYITLMEIAQ